MEVEPGEDGGHGHDYHVLVQPDLFSAVVSVRDKTEIVHLQKGLYGMADGEIRAQSGGQRFGLQSDHSEKIKLIHLSFLSIYERFKTYCL